MEIYVFTLQHLHSFYCVNNKRKIKSNKNSSLISKKHLSALTEINHLTNFLKVKKNFFFFKFSKGSAKVNAFWLLESHSKCNYGRN